MNDVDRVNERDATIAALQARVKELEDDRSAWKEIAQDWSAAAKLAEQPEKFYEGYSAAVMNAMQALLTKARADLARVTAELEAAQARVRELEESRDAWRASQECSEKAYMALVNQIPAERFDYDPINVALLDGAKEQEIIGRKQIADLQAELERVSAERDELKGQRDTMQEHINLAVPKLQEADTLRTLILALPKVEGEITCSQQFDSAWRLHYWQVEAYGVADECLYRLSNLREEEAKAYAALLKHRQGMEG